MSVQELNYPKSDISGVIYYNPSHNILTLFCDSSEVWLGTKV